MRSIKGSSDEAKGARKSLQAQLDGERSSITKNTLELLKLGTSSDRVNSQTKKLADEAKKLTEGSGEAAKKHAELSKAVQGVGGPLGDVIGRVESLKPVLSAATSGFGAMALGITAAVAAVAAVTVAIAAATVALVQWIFESGQANRTAALLREGWTGTAESGLHLRNQIDAVANSVPLARDRLQELAGDSVRALSGTMVSGQGIVDTFAAVSTASAAMGDQVGAQLQSIIDRSKTFGRVAINPFELQGTGITRDDIAKQLGSITKKSVSEARLALATGRVDVNLFAEALRKAAEVRFGDTLKKRMLDVNVVSMRLKEAFHKLTEDINFAPLNGFLEKIEHSLDKSSITGKALHDVITSLGDAIMRNLGSVDTTMAIVKFETAVIKMGVGVLKVLVFIKQHWDGIRTAIDLAKASVVGFAEAIPGVGAAIKVAKTAGAVADIVRGVTGGRPTPGPEPAGPEMVGAPVVRRPALAGHASGGMIPSPAPGEVFVSASPGETIVPAGMSLQPSGGGGAGRQLVSVKLIVNIDASGHAQASQVAAAVSAPTVMGQLTKAVEDVLVQMGLAPQAQSAVS
jgi:hypothetical protein